MYKQQLNHGKHLKLFFTFLFVTLMSSAFALSTDNQQDMDIEADTADMDDAKGITIYRGDVIVTQGSMLITGHTMTVYFDDNDDMELAIMQGSPATYRQLPDNSEVYDEAESLQMEYYALKDYIILIDKAWMSQEGGKISGARIEYDTVRSRVIAKGSTRTAKTKDGTSKKKKDGRVKITIKKKKQE